MNPDALAHLRMRSLRLWGTRFETPREAAIGWAQDPAPARTPGKPVVDLVQGYDEIIMSYSESRDASFRVGGPYYHAVLLDGRLVGHWKPIAQGNAVRIETVLTRALTRPEAKALTATVGLTAAWMRGK